MASTTSKTPIQLPVIDISNPLDAAVGKQMVSAAVKYGFFYVRGKGSDFSAQEVDQTFALSKKFFASPREDKTTCAIRTDNRGWSGMHVETLDPEHQRTGDYKEGMNFGEFRNGKAQQPLSATLKPHEADLDHFATLCNQTCARVMRLLALGLEIDSEYFVTRHDAANGPTGSILRFLYYPSVSNPASSSYRHGVDVRAGAHSDYGTLTLLFQRPGQPGLEILNPEDGRSWSPVPVWPDGGPDDDDHDEASFPPILINIGDMLSFWTNGLLRSTVHRVVFPAAEQNRPVGHQSQDRYSVVFFCQPVDGCNLVPPVPSPLVAAAAASKAHVENEKVGFGGGAGSLGEHKSLTAKEYLDMRLLATYGHREEVTSA